MKARLEPAWCRALAGKQVGDYMLVEFVGAGKVGYVYKAEHIGLAGKYRAIKLTFTLNIGWENELQKVMALELVQDVVHFHGLGTVAITHDNQTQMCQYSVWDFIAPGRSLSQYIVADEIQTSFLVAVVEQILRVLHACDQEGVARHGDLHSGNILVGNPSPSSLDDALQPRVPVFVSDFGYGATGALPHPKDDYSGLAKIINEIIPHIDYAKTTSTDKQILKEIRDRLGKLLNEREGPDRKRPLEALQLLHDIREGAQSHIAGIGTTVEKTARSGTDSEQSRVGQFQVSEMIGDRWDWWRRLFVWSVPARSKILGRDIPTVVTGPRGCGKTMLFRRLSSRLIVECGAVEELEAAGEFAALYVNANDFADAFARYPDKPSLVEEQRLVCYANLCLLGEVLSVQSARAGKMQEAASDELLELVRGWLIPAEFSSLVAREDRLERYRTILEQIKWKFPSGSEEIRFPALEELSQFRWLPHFVQLARGACPWIGSRTVFIFVDDFSTPRVSSSMQRVLNRLFLQRSPEFLAKVATEAASTFVPEDSSNKNLQDGDDYQLVDMGEESLFLPDEERLAFLSDVFVRRLSHDPRIPNSSNSLAQLLGRMPLSKTEFARRLRSPPADLPAAEETVVDGTSQRRGRSRSRVLYFGENVFSDLWSGDTRTMIQLISDVVAQAAASNGKGDTPIALPVKKEDQDQVFRNRGGEWLNSHTRNEPTDPRRMRAELARIQVERPSYKLSGEYGDHLKAVVEAFVYAARQLLMGPTYRIYEAGAPREVPRMAFRVEIIDEFRVDGLAQEIYRDLIRYGLFMRDNRGKSIRGAFVPRLYLRRLLLPFCTLALSKRDSVPLKCEEFIQMLLAPDSFKTNFSAKRHAKSDVDQPEFNFGSNGSTIDPNYDDEVGGGSSH